MNSQKFLLGGIVGGVVFFILGWVVYGMLLKDFMASNLTTMRPQSDMVWWALIVGQLAGGFLFAYIIGKANATSAGAGAGVGFLVGLLLCLSYDLTIYATSTAIATLKGVAADVAVSAVMSAIAGAVIGGVMGMGKKAVAVA